MQPFITLNYQKNVLYKKSSAELTYYGVDSLSIFSEIYLYLFSKYLISFGVKFF